MRFIIIHKTNARWEAGEIPDRELIADVGQLIGELKEAGILQAGDGLRASSLGARVTFRGGVAEVTPGPFTGTNELPAGFDIIRAATLDEAVQWAFEVGRVLGDAEMDVRPVTEPWDIGLAPRPDGVTSQRFMVLRKATAQTESGAPLASEKRAALAEVRVAGDRALLDRAHRGRFGTGPGVPTKIRAENAGGLLSTETMRPSARGRRYKNTAAGIAFTDGPFTESKELIAGFVIIDVPSLDEASRWCARYIQMVRAEEADVLELDEP